MATKSAVKRTWRILVLYGPNLNVLGIHRDKKMYGSLSLEEINTRVREGAKRLHADLRFAQHNCEGALITEIQSADGWADAIVINPGALAHYSIALRDAIADARVPTMEVHFSNTASREAFRHHSVTASVCVGKIEGLGWVGILLAIEGIIGMLQDSAAARR